MENLIEKTKRYFELFSTKNVKGLENEIYADDVYLRDWNGEWKGKQAVLEMNENLFQNDFTIEIEEIADAGNIAVVLFKLSIGDVTYNVCDYICWNDSEKIQSIRAFNG